ncbi:MAG: hypothetical protein ACRDIU_09235 [Actinomycetota bacterium]
MSSQKDERTRMVARLALASVLLTVVAGAYIGLRPCFYQGVESRARTSPGSAETGPVQERRFCKSLVEVNGASALWVLLFPLAVSGGGAFAARYRLRAIVWLCAFFLLSFTLAGALSIGIFFLPSALLMIGAAAVLRPA